MNNVGNVPVLIVGGGPIGLALALDLGRRGIRSILIERDPGTGTELLAKADFLNERSMEFCRQLGIADEVVGTSFPDDVSRDTVYCTSLNGYFIGRYPLPSTRERPLPPQCREMHRRCPQFWFDPLLARAVVRQGMTDLRYGMTIDRFEQDVHGVTCTLKQVNGGSVEDVRVHYLVACDGAGSFVRKALGIRFSGDHLGYSVSVVVRVEHLERFHPLGMGERYMFISPEGTWANLTSVDGRALYRFTVIGSADALDLARLDINAEVRRALGRDDISFELMRVMPWRRSQFTADQFHDGRVFLAGDAAHTTSPTGGHGLNTGLGDVMDLGWILQALAQGWGGPLLGEAYTNERRQVAIRNGVSSTKNYANWVAHDGREMVLDPGPEADAQRHTLGERISTALRQEFSSLGVAMGYDYTGSSAIIPDGSPQPPDDPSVYVQTARPGHRAPHCWLEDGRSIIDLFGLNFVLLIFGVDAPGIHLLVNAARLVDMPLDCVTITEPEVASLYECKFALVRPDGMVAWRSDALPDDPAWLIDRVRGMSSAAKPTAVRTIADRGLVDF